MDLLKNALNVNSFAQENFIQPSFGLACQLGSFVLLNVPSKLTKTEKRVKGQSPKVPKLSLGNLFRCSEVNICRKMIYST